MPVDTPSSLADRLLELHRHVRALKAQERRGWGKRGVLDPESVADHSFGVCMLALLGARELGLDSSRAVVMALIHELCEALVGDIIPADGIAPAEKQRREEDAVRQILARLDPGGELLELWLDFEHQRTPEGHLVKELDRLEMALQARAYQARGGLDLHEFVESARALIHRPELVEAVEREDVSG